LHGRWWLNWLSHWIETSGIIASSYSQSIPCYSASCMYVCDHIGHLHNYHMTYTIPPCNMKCIMCDCAIYLYITNSPIDYWFGVAWLYRSLFTVNNVALHDCIDLYSQLITWLRFGAAQAVTCGGATWPTCNRMDICQPWQKKMIIIIMKLYRLHPENFAPLYLTF
jgi:hypothetical protein